VPDLKLNRQTVAQSPKVVVVSLAGQVEGANGLQAERYFDEMLRQEQPRHVLLDLRGLTFAGSVFFSSLLFWRETLARQGGQLVLYGLRPEISSTMRILALDEVLPISADQPSALETVSRTG
jgi:anti-anti-sigma factor